MTDREISQLATRLDRLDGKIDHLHADITRWLHGDPGGHPGVLSRLDRLEQAQQNKRRAESTIIALISSALSGSVVWIIHLFSGGK